MNEPIFVESRHHYDSYTDFWRLVRLSGFHTCYVDEMVLEDENRTYIMTPLNGEFQRHTDRRHWKKCKIVWWNLEPTDGVSPAARMQHPAVALFDDIWVADRWASQGHPTWRHAVLGGHPGLQATSPRPETPQYDYAHLCYAWGRRENVFNSLKAAGLKEAPTKNLYGAAASAVLNDARVMLNLHQHARMPIIAPLRFASAAAHGMLLITERCNDYFPHHYGRELARWDLNYARDSLATLIRKLTPAQAPEMVGELQRTLHEVWSFRNGVEDALHRWRTDGEKVAR